jgi:hypothetical protein
MKRTRSIIVTAVVSLAAVVAAGAWYTSSASAGTSQAEREAPAEFKERICTGEFDLSSRADRAQDRRDSLLAEIAAEMGVEPAELEEAVRSVLTGRLDERLADAVEAGHITEDQADELVEAAESGTLAEVLKQYAADRSGDRWERRGALRERIADRVCD